MRPLVSSVESYNFYMNVLCNRSSSEEIICRLCSFELKFVEKQKSAIEILSKSPGECSMWDIQVAEYFKYEIIKSTTEEIK